MYVKVFRKYFILYVKFKKNEIQPDILDYFPGNGPFRVASRSGLPNGPF